MATTPADALDALRGMRDAIAAALATDDEEAIAAAVEDLARYAEALDLEDVTDADDVEAWQPVADELHALMAWLDEPAPEGKAARAGCAVGIRRREQKAMSRERRMQIAIAIATRGRGLRRRRRTPGDVLLEGFEAGVGHLLRGAWAALKLTVRGIAFVSRHAVAGAIQVAEHYRNGRRVAAHTRAAPGKSLGAHHLYR